MKTLFLTIIALIASLGSLHAMDGVRVMVENQTSAPIFIFAHDKPGSEPRFVASLEGSENIMLPKRPRKGHSIFISTSSGMFEVYYGKPAIGSFYQVGLYKYPNNIRSIDNSQEIIVNKDAEATNMLVVIDPSGTGTLTNRTKEAKSTTAN